MKNKQVENLDKYLESLAKGEKPSSLKMDKKTRELTLLARQLNEADKEINPVKVNEIKAVLVSKKEGKVEEEVSVVGYLWRYTAVLAVLAILIVAVIAVYRFNNSDVQIVKEPETKTTTPSMPKEEENNKETETKESSVTKIATNKISQKNLDLYNSSYTWPSEIDNYSSFIDAEESRMAIEEKDPEIVASMSGTYEEQAKTIISQGEDLIEKMQETHIAAMTISEELDEESSDLDKVNEAVEKMSEHLNLMQEVIARAKELQESENELDREEYKQIINYLQDLNEDAISMMQESIAFKNLITTINNKND